jgi:hypothetical protein
MTEPSSGTPSPLPAEPAEPDATDPGIAPDPAFEADLEGNGQDDEADAEELDLDEDDEAEPESSAPETAAPGVSARPAGGPGVRRRAGAPAVAPHVATQSELAVRVTDSPSRFFVIATVVIFAGILAYGVLAGHGGVLTPRATPAPTVAASVAPSGSAAPSASAGASATDAASPAASASPSAAPSASPS